MTDSPCVLVVDDSEMNLRIVEEILEGRFDLHTAASGEQALAMVGEVRPEILLLDVMMPGIDGYETCRRLREIESLRHVKIIMMSAKAMLVDRLRGYEAGADDYITKPFDDSEFVAKLHVHARLSRVEGVDWIKGQVLSMLCPRGRAPLEAILAPLELLMSPAEVSRDERVALARVGRESVQGLFRLLENVLTLSSMEAGTWQPTPEWVDLGDVIRTAEERASSRYPERRSNLEHEIGEDARARVDAAHAVMSISAVMETLLRLSPPNADVVTGVTGDGSEWSIEMRCETREEIDEAQIAAMLAPFGPPSLESRDLHELALPAARGIFEAHGGSLCAHGDGAGLLVVSVRWPVLESDHAPKRQPEPSPR